MNALSSLVLSVAIVLGTPLGAQSSCSTTTLPGASLVGVDGTVIASVRWDPDGAGPLAPVVVLAGEFEAAGDTFAANIVAWDPVTSVWTPLGSGLGGRALALAVAANGDLLVGGTFDSAGGVAAPGLARWNGTAWSPLGLGISAQGFVNAIAVDPAGDVFVGGVFSSLGGVPVQNVARWDGTSWSALANGVNGRVNTLTIGAAGQLYAGGWFTGASGVFVNRCAVWDGSSWAALGSGFGSPVFRSVLAANGDLVVTGPLVAAPFYQVPGIWRWDGVSWSTLGGIPVVAGNALALLSNGDIVTNGGVASPTPAHAGVVRFDGSTWSPVGGSFDQTSADILTLVESATGQLVAAGRFTSVGGVGMQRVAQWDGSTWSPANVGSDGSSRTVTVMPNGDIVMAGYFATVDGVPAQGIARWNGTSWSDLGIGLSGALGLAVDPNAELFAIDGNAAHVWTGTSWSSIGAASGGIYTMESICAHPDGGVVVGGDFTSVGGVAANSVARWHAGTWTPLAQGVPDRILALACTAAGDVVAAGLKDGSSISGNRVWRWSGGAWSQLGAGMSSDSVIEDLAVLANGDVVACGTFGTADNAPAVGVARWDGSGWHSMDLGLNGDVDCLQALPNGDVIAGGRMFSTVAGAPLRHLARWNGVAWEPAGSVIASIDFGGSAVRDLAFHPTGQLVLAGDFAGVDGVLSAGLARLETPCPATVTPIGAACASSGGANSLEARSQPWVGSLFECEGVGLPTTALIAIDGGLMPSAPVPLTALSIPAALPGCALHLVPSYLEIAITTNGTATWSWPIPNDATFAGLQVYFQMVVLEVDPQFQIIESTSTNALELTLGAY